MIAAALVALFCSYWFARRVFVSPVSVSWSETCLGSRRLISLGLAFMWGGVLGAGLDMFTRSIIVTKYGVEAAGLYQAAWALAGVFASFILRDGRRFFSAPDGGNS
jgi:PST family polysaccharide transporter